MSKVVVTSRPINLTQKPDDQILSIREQFEEFKKKQTVIANVNYKFDLQTGDRILFKNGYDVEMETEILGFNEDGDAYLLWDCYWFPIRLKERLIKKL